MKYLYRTILIILFILFGFIYILKYQNIFAPTPYRSSYKNKVWLISFAEGKVHQLNQDFLKKNALKQGFDVIISYGKKDIDPTFYKKHKNILDQKRGAGYWLWKPYLIKKTLDMMQDDDVLFYIDSGASLLTNSEFFIEKLDINKSNILLFNNFHKNKGYIKRDAYEIMGLSEEYKEYKQIAASMIIIKKNPKSTAFIEKWLEYCKDPNLITDSPSKKPEYDDFIDHRHDQAILTLLYYKYPEEISRIDYHSPEICDKIFHHRRTAFNESLELFYYLYKFDGGLCHKGYSKYYDNSKE